MNNIYLSPHFPPNYRRFCLNLKKAAADMHAVYFNSPLNQLSGISDAWHLDYYRQRKIIACVGQGAWEEEGIADTRSLDALFRKKSIPPGSISGATM